MFTRLIELTSKAGNGFIAMQQTQYRRPEEGSNIRNGAECFRCGPGTALCGNSSCRASAVSAH